MAAIHDLTSEERLHLLAKAAKAHAIIFLDPDGLIADWSAGARHLLGWSAEEICGRSVTFLYSAEDQACDVPLADMAEALSHGQACAVRWQRHKDGSGVFMDGVTYALRDELGALIGYSRVLHEAEARGGQVSEAPTWRVADAVKPNTSSEHQFLQAVLDNVKDGIVACSPDGELTLFNRATRDFHGMAEAALPAENWAGYYDLYCSDGVTPLEKEEIPLYRALRGEHIRGIEMVIAPRTGRRRIVSVSGQPLVDAGGRKLGAVVSMHDITSRREAEAARERVIQEQARREQAEKATDRMRLSEQRFRSLIMATAQVVWTANAKGEIIEDSLTWREFTGQSFEEYQGLGWLGAVHPEDRERAARDWQVSTTEAAVYECEYRLRRRDGQYRWTLARGVLIRDLDGSVREWVGINTDVTEVKQATEALRKSERQALAAAHQAEAERNRLDAVLEAVPVGIIVADSSGAILEINSANRRLLGGPQPLFQNGTQSEAESESDGYHEWNSEWSRDWRGWWADGSERQGQPVKPREWPLARAVRGEAVSQNVIEIETFDTPPVRKTLLVSGAPIRGNGGAVTGGVVALMDITDRVSAQASLREQAERLRFTLEAAQIGDWDLDLITDTANRSLRHDQCFGATEPITDWDFAEFLRRVHPDDRQRVRREFKTAVTEFEDWHFEARVIWPDASVHWIAVHGSVYGEQGKTTRMVGIIFDITERKHVEETVRHASLHDPLTGLPNRSMLFEYASHLLPRNRRANQCAAVLFLDLDRFKPINDTHGHEVGDAVLKEVAARLTRTLRAEDIIVRLGGDEFLILLQDIREKSYAAEVAQHIAESIGDPYPVGSLMLSLSTSIGISVFPEDGDTLDILISHADMAMYQAKQAGHNNCQFFSKELGAGTRKQRIIEQQLIAALNNQDFHLFYQPILDLETGEVVSVEALLRWQHSEVGPEQFIPIAEATGIINPIGRWLLREASQQHRAWLENGLPAMPIAVNVSVVEFRDRGFVDRFRKTLQSQGIDISALQLEITETAVMDDFDHAVTLLTQLKALGVTILLDDFGTGHSSLAYLARLPLDKVKIDKSFISGFETDQSSRAVAEAMIALGRTLSLVVVAEGIESAQALDYVKAQGCSQGQGFHFARPMSGAAFEAWYRQRSRSRDLTSAVTTQDR